MRRPAASLLWLSAAIAASLLAACGADQGAAAPAVPPTAVAAPVSSGAAGAPSALQFSADLVGGGQVDFRRYAGTTLALWFWAPT